MDSPNTAGSQYRTLTQPELIKRGSQQLQLGLRGDQGFELAPGKLGSGGMGVVREAHQRCLGRAVAIKSVIDDKAGHSLEELVREAQVLAKLEHPNIVPVYTVCLLEGKPAIVLKKIVGKKWADLISQAGFDWNIGVFQKVADAVRFAHSRGILHRDLKPSNVMIGEFGEVYLLDWGNAVSTVYEEGSAILPAAQISRSSGSPPYMAPEMLDPQWALNTDRTDVYLLGAVLYEIVMGAPPHVADTREESYEKIYRSQPRYSSELSTELVALLQNAMRRDPALRFDSVAALQDALAAFLEHRSSRELAVRGRILTEALKIEIGEPRKQRAEVYAIYRRCKFLFQESLRSWHGNLSARNDQTRAVEMMVDFELSRCDPAAAATLLVEQGIAEGEWHERVVFALRAQQQQAEEALLLRNDVDLGRDCESRRLAMSGIGLLWIVVPLMLDLFLAKTSYASQSIVHVAFLGVWGLIGFLGKGWIDSTFINRGIYSIVLGAGLSAVTINFGSWMMGLPGALAQVYHLFVFFAAAVTTVFVVDWRAWPSMAAFALAFVVAAHSPAYCLLAMAAANCVLTVNAWRIWRS